MIYITIMVYKSIVLVLFIIGLQVPSLTAQKGAEGSSEFSHATGSGYVHDLKEGNLLIRLEDETQRLSYMRSRGKIQQAQKLEDDTNSRNQNMIKYFKKHFDFCPIYFYYSSDANAVLRDRNFDLLWTDSENKATKLSFDKPPFIMKYGPVEITRWDPEDKFILHSWDYNTLKPITNSKYPLLRMKRWTRRILKQDPSLRNLTADELELLIMKLNSFYHKKVD